MIRKVIIRADGDSTMGMGHLMRCFALAQMLTPDFEVQFLCVSAPESFSKLVQSKNIGFKQLLSHDSIFEFIGSEKFLVVLDGYHFPVNYDKSLSEKSTVIWIDDIPGDFKYADALINHAPGISATEYSISPQAVFCLGPQFALLQPDFLGVEKKSVNDGSNRITSLFICFGGADPQNYSLKFLDQAVQISWLDKIQIALGGANTNLELIESLAAANDRVQLFYNVSAEEMAALYRSNSAVLVPSSGVLMEALACNNSVVSGWYVPNQKRFFSDYCNFFQSLDLQNAQVSDLEEAILKAIQQPNITDVFDGKSPERILKLFKKLELIQDITLRIANLSDIDLTYQWASNPEIRRFSFQTEPIPYDTHSAWFTAKVNASNCIYFIGELNEVPFGSIRFDIDSNSNRAVLSYLVDPEFHGKGLGQLLLSRAILEIWKNYSHIKEIIGFVMPENVASLIAFRQLAFTEETSDKGQKFTLTL